MYRITLLLQLGFDKINNKEKALDFSKAFLLYFCLKNVRPSICSILACMDHSVQRQYI